MFLPKILAVITRHPRYKVPNLSWDRNLLTPNIFRLFEFIFWKRCGPNGVGDTIKKESSAQFRFKGNELTVAYRFYTLEAVLAHFEGLVRNYFTLPKFRFEFVQMPQWAVANGPTTGLPIFSFAIAFDAKNNGIQNTGGLTMTISQTCTGSNLLLLCGYSQDQTAGSPTIDSATYNSVAMTKLDEVVSFVVNIVGVFYKVGPSTGTNNLVVTRSAGTNTLEGGCASYSGVSQSGFPDAHNTNTGVKTDTITTVADNCWVTVVAFNDTGGALSGVTNLALRQAFPDNNRGLLDSNAALTPAGAKTITWTYAGSPLATHDADCALSFAPVGAAVTAIVTPQLLILGVG